MGFWKSIAAAVIGAIISAALITSFITPSAPPAVTIGAKIHWIDFSNPLARLSLTDFDNLIKSAQAQWPKADIARFMEGTRFRPELRLFRLELKNHSKTRAKSIDVTGPKVAFMYSAQSDSKPLSSSISINGLNPNAEAAVLGATDGWSRFQTDPPILVLHDGIKVETINSVFSDDLTGLATIVQNNPGWTSMLMFFLIVTTLLGLIAMFVAIAKSVNIDRSARWTPKEGLAQMITLLDYVKEKYPEKWQAAQKPPTDVDGGPKSNADPSKGRRSRSP